MSKKPNTKVKLYDNHVLKPIKGIGHDFSASVREDFHLERKDGIVVQVSDGLTDYQKLIQSHANEAGLVNILKLQEMRYGTIDNAIARNKEKQTFADVSNIPDSIAEQKAMVEKANAEIQKLADELGLSKEDLLNLTAERYVEIKQAQAAASAASEGGAE